MFDYIVRKVFGLYAADQISDPENDLMGLFSNTFVHRSFLLVDELENSRHFTGKLKNMVTCDKLRYEKKGKDTIKVDNLTNMIFTTNVDGALYVSPRDRRFVFFECSNIHRDDMAYVDMMLERLRDPRMPRALYQYLMKQDISEFPNGFQGTRPITKYYQDKRDSSIPLASRFLSSLVLQDGGCPVEMHLSDFYIKYKAYYTEYLEGKDMSKILGKKELSKFVEGSFKDGGGMEKARTETRRFWKIDPVLLKARLVNRKEFDEDPMPW